MNPNSPGRLISVLLAGLCLCLATGAAAAAAPPSISSVTASQRDAVTTVSISLSGPAGSFFAYREADPPRVVVELEGFGPGEDAEPLEINDGLVTAISRQDADINGRRGTRLTVGLAREAAYECQPQDSRLILTLSAAGEPQAATTPAPAATTPAPAATTPAPAVTPREAPAAEAQAASQAADSGQGGGPCRIKAIEFRSLASGKSRLRVATTGRASYELARVSRESLLLTLKQASLPPELARPLDTSQFAQAAVDEVKPAPSGADTAVAVRFRQVVPYHLLQDDGELSLEFDACPAKPNPQVTLAARQSQPAAAPAEAAPEAERQAVIQQAASRAPEDILAPPEPPGAASGLPAAVKVIYPGTQRRFSGQRISLDFQSADVHNVLRLIAEVSGLNVITSDDVKGRVTMRLKRIPWDQALDIILATCNLAMSRTGDVIRIAPAARFRDEQKQAEEAAKEALDAAKKKEQLVPLVTKKFRVNYGKAEAMKKQIEEVLSPRGKTAFDERTNVVIVTDVAEGVETARDLIESLDWPTPQVMIEARIVEAQTTFSRELGVQWGAQYSRAFGSIDGTIGVQGRSGVTGQPSAVPFLVNLPTTTTLGGIGLSYLSSHLNIDARLLASEQQGKLRIISAPRIATLDNSEAYIQQGEDIPYLAQSVDGISTQFVQTKLCLTVTPHITPDGRVRMRIKTEKSEPSDREINGTPGILRKESVTEVLVNNGETVVLGGILKDKTKLTENRIPYFHKIPFLGWLFKGEVRNDEKQELLIFITPKIVSVEEPHLKI